MLEKDRFLEIKELAREIRSENEQLFESLKNVSLEEAIKEKEEFIEAVISNMGLEFSAGEKGKEEKQIFRANVLIPDDVEFFQTYSKDKNIRNLMNRYLVNIEDVMSKITELNIYGKYNELFNATKEKDFVEEMIKENDTEERALDLLDEIKSLTSEIDNTLEEIEKPAYHEQSLEIFAAPTPEDDANESIDLLKPEEIPSEENEVKPEEIIESIIEEPIVEPIIEEPIFETKKETMPETNLPDMNEAVLTFVDSYNDLKAQNEKMQLEIEKLQNKLSELSETLEKTKDNCSRAAAENEFLKATNAKLETQIVESKALISKIYSCIAPK